MFKYSSKMESIAFYKSEPGAMKFFHIANVKANLPDKTTIVSLVFEAEVEWMINADSDPDLSLAKFVEFVKTNIGGKVILQLPEDLRDELKAKALGILNENGLYAAPHFSGGGVYSALLVAEKESLVKTVSGLDVPDSAGTYTTSTELKADEASEFMLASADYAKGDPTEEYPEGPKTPFYTPKAFEDRLGVDRYVAARDTDGNLAGMLGYMISGGLLYCFDLATREDCRGAGVAMLMYKALFTELSARHDIKKVVAIGHDYEEASGKTGNFYIDALGFERAKVFDADPTNTTFAFFGPRGGEFEAYDDRVEAEYKATRPGMAPSGAGSGSA